MQEVSLKKHILLLERIKEVVKSSKRMFEEQELSKFFSSVSDTISKLYPTVNRKIAK